MVPCLQPEAGPVEVDDHHGRKGEAGCTGHVHHETLGVGQHGALPGEVGAGEEGAHGNARAPPSWEGYEESQSGCWRPCPL